MADPDNLGHQEITAERSRLLPPPEPKHGFFLGRERLKDRLGTCSSPAPQEVAIRTINRLNMVRKLPALDMIVFLTAIAHKSAWAAS